ncbi:MAG TPA: SUMF1/EgtB/PvdO family nonheme iron enzyme [Chitinophagales bacterium]|nr:SUMF1/EgtB/PvdO family nonheme iron enzyme [Chitinophagales bacterium]
MNTKNTILLLLCLSIGTALHAQTLRGLYVPDNNGGTRPAQNEKRVALVIGNQNYQSGWQPLNNPVNDANAIETALKLCGFEVIKLTNTNRTQMLDGINNFVKRITGSETVALFAYAGHGIEADGKNYLIPTDDASRCRDDISVQAISLDFVQQKMNNAGAAMKIMIIDACRNNPLPFTCPSASRSAEAQSFVQYAPKGTFVAFSTAPGQTASDGTRGTNSPYVDALVKALKQEGLTIEQLFKQVRRQLDQIGQQTWDYNGYTGDFYFKPAKTNPPTPAPNNTVVNNNTTPPSTPKPDVSRDLPNLPEVVFVRGGTFTMGDTFGEGGSNEKPHEVTVGDFYMGKYEVTFEEYDLFCEATGREKPSDQGWGRGKRPVINVSWHDAVAYCEWASRTSGKKYRLPTEAEWEYAAREGGKKVRFGNGKDIIDPAEANFDGSESYKKSYSRTGTYREKTVAVGSFKPNALGIYDMAGNVWEWCSDWYAADYYQNSPRNNPQGPASGSIRVLRGGSWTYCAVCCRVSYRDYITPTIRDDCYGFRVALVP